ASRGRPRSRVDGRLAPASRYPPAGVVGGGSVRAVSLRHALLGVLKDRPLTGYDLVRYFQGTLGFLWSAPQSQIYPELRRMEAAGLVTATVKPRGQKAQKRVYAVTEAGMAELRRWATDFMPPPGPRGPGFPQAAFFCPGPLDPGAATPKTPTPPDH